MSTESIKLTNTIISNLGRIGNTFLIAACIAFCVWQIQIVAVAWAGKTTTATIDLDAKGKLEWGDKSIQGGEPEESDSSGEDILSALCFYVGVGGLFTGFLGIRTSQRQRRLRQDSVSHLAPYKTMYEKLIDQQRSSSGLMHNGETRPEDM